MKDPLKLKNGQYKDFTCALVGYQMKHKQEDTNSQALHSAMITAGLKGLTPKEQREIIYSDTSHWKCMLHTA